MDCPRCLSSMLLIAVATCSGLRAEDSDAALDPIREAIAKAIPLLEQGSQGSAEQRTCFTCHNQALPILALAAAKRHGFSVDADNLQHQVRHTVEHLIRGREGYLEGRGQGGQVITAGYALWALEASGFQPDETTDAVTHYLLEFQKDSDRWSHPGQRPPSSGSDFTTTYVALRGLGTFGSDEQQAAIDERTETVGGWLLSNAPADTEDRVFRLRALVNLSAGERAVDEAVDELLSSQRDDGGWAQTAGRDSDAYATGTVLAALIQTGCLPRDAPAVTRGVQHLLDTQLEDGSWHVVSRAEPFQTYFESGFPHGTDQFISIAASSWAVVALLEALPKVESP
ncbi:MAG: prenyltransferase/squalene oxidase repeat-containing protein [Planctomycetaceae bacterium]